MFFLKKSKIALGPNSCNILNTPPRVESQKGLISEVSFVRWAQVPQLDKEWMVTIPSLDQWLATIGNHWKTIDTNGPTVKNHWETIVSNGKTIGKTIDTNGPTVKNHWKNIVSYGKTIGKTIDTNGPTIKNHWKTIVPNEKTIGKTIDTNGWHVKNHWHSIVPKNWPSLWSSWDLLKVYSMNFWHTCTPWQFSNI